MRRILLLVATLILLCKEDVVNSYVQPLNHCLNLQKCRPSSPTFTYKSALFSTKVNGDKSKLSSSEKTLYEILNSTPDATRSELKRNYIELVRKTHPDALISRNNDDVNINNNDDPEFQQIMQAWRTLSNPFERKRYDRKLRAAAFTSQVENVFGEIGKNAGPQFLNAFENIAIPFLRRSAATTMAGINSVSKDISKYGSEDNTATGSGLSGIFNNAIQSGVKAGKAVDCLELMEKSRELSKRSKASLQKSQQLKDELNEIVKQRINLSLHTPNVNITSYEAMAILDGMNTTDEVTMTDILRLRHKVSYEIEQLKQKEDEFQKSKDLNVKLKKDVEENTLALEQANANAEKALQAEERARKALNDAQMLVARTKKDVENSISLLSSVTDGLNQNESDLGKHLLAVTKQQEKVRVALRRKDDNLPDSSPEKIKGDLKADEVNDSAEAIQGMLKEEQYLREESARLAAKAERLASRAQKLEEKANEIEKGEEEAWVALEESVKVAEEAAKSGYGKFNGLKDKNGINVNK